MELSEQIQAELKRLGVKSATELSRCTLRVTVDRRHGEVEIIIPNPQISVSGSSLEIHFRAIVDIGMMAADSVIYTTHMGRWYPQDPPGYSFQGDSPMVTVDIVRDL